MHLYREQHRQYEPVHQWNSVDVLTDSGLFQHGEVINVAENGLIVDFHCSGQRAQFVSFDKIFDSSEAPCSAPYEDWHRELQWNPALTENASVQVLCRPHPGAAWLWYPARLLQRAFFFPFDNIGMVWAAVDAGDRPLTELLPADQVRSPPSEPMMTLPSGSFIVRVCRLPVDFWATTTFLAADHFHQQLEGQKVGVRVLVILRESLRYLQRTDDKPMTDEEVRNIYESSKEKFSEQQDTGAQNSPGLLQPAVLETSRKRKHPDDPAQPEVEWVLPTAPHLLCEIFHSLDSISRVKLRRVCTLWNALLTGADSGRVVRITFALKPFFPLDNYFRVLGAVAGLLKCTTASTDRIIIEHMVAEHVDAALVLLKSLLKNLRLKQLIFHHVEMDWDDTFEHEYTDSGILAVPVEEFVGRGKKCVRRLAKVLRNWASCCDELHLHRCVFTCIEGKMTASIPDARIKLDAADIEAQFWELYDANLSRDGINLEEAAEWIRTGSEALRTMVARYLVDWQSHDPRSTTQYRDREWTVDNLQDLDVSRLTTITLHALKERLPEDMDEMKNLD
ncbi:uncharacterized protein LOC129595442 [Paramacrobiotus metropolitanus]|uniref:uncharacterized protein LOC129595442 n=1 Tax=Paramacrobiotus metropolitanus TaxID=2943436 RepID=UPI002445ABCF|nr:uncharacterized protein LOC129595442 [Paramacrobiotus metropolitanus]